MRKLLALAAILAMASAAHAADDPTLAKLAGSWVGNGLFRWDSVTDPERVYCEISGSLMPDGTLHESGRCALTTDSAALTFDIRSGGNGTYSGSVNAGLGLRKATPFTGTGKANHMVLSVPASDGTAATTTTIDVISGGFHALVERIDAKTGKKYSVGDVTFSPQ